MALPTVTVLGRLTADPELRFTPSGKAVANFTIAASARRKNQQTNEWEDGEKCFLRCAVWDVQGENVAESLLKGQEVCATGRLYQREYTTNEGEKRTVFEMKIDTIAAAITAFAQVKVNKLERVGAASGGGGGSQDSWGSAQGSYSDEPPF